jgi:hypothetical protein
MHMGEDMDEVRVAAVFGGGAAASGGGCGVKGAGRDVGLACA